MLPTAPRLPAWFDPLVELLRDTWVTPAELAAHHRVSVDHLAGLRRKGRGVPFTKFDTGAVRYRQGDIVAAELRGAAGPLTVQRACLAILASPDLDDRAKGAAQLALRRAFPTG